MTLLGLLLVVTVLANFLATQLPAQMRVNDENHVLTVQNEVARWDGLLRSGAEAGAVEAVFSQPIELGSSGAPPFAGPDGSVIGPAPQGSQLSVSFSVTGPAGYAPPSGYPEGGSTPCTLSPSTDPSEISCSTSSSSSYNFNGNGRSFIGTYSGSGNSWSNYSTNSSYIRLGLTGSGRVTLQLFGSHNTIYFTGTGSGPTKITIVGNYDNVSVNTTGSQAVFIEEVGNYDPITFPTASQSGAFTLVIYGSYDPVGFTSVSGSGNFYVYDVGFSSAEPTSTQCPYSNLSSTDGVTAFPTTGSGSLYNYLNNTVGYNHTTQNSAKWSTTWEDVHLSSCPYFSAATFPKSSSGVNGASFLLDLRNTYAPPAVVAYDQGGLVFAEPGGQPIMLVGPGLTYASGTLGLWVPEFTGPVGSEEGTATAEISARLVSVLNLTLPSDGYTLGASVVLSVTTSYGPAWWGYFNTTFPSITATCSSSVAAGCDGPYELNGPLGTVAVTIPATALDLQVATYSITLT